MSEALPWSGAEPLSNPPLICESCGGEIPDGVATLSAEDHLICGFCSRGNHGYLRTRAAE